MNKNKTKNFLIITGIFKPDIGGPSIFVNALDKHIRKNNKFESFIITFSNIKKPFTTQKNILRINRNLPKLIRVLITIYFIRKYSKRCDSILCCGLIFETFIGTIKINKKKVFRFVGDSIWEKYIGSQNRGVFGESNFPIHIKIILLVRNIFLRNFEVIITPSNYLKKYLVNNLFCDENKIKIINNFADIDENYINANEIRIINKQKSKKFRLVTLSRLTKWKNIDQVIKATSNMYDIELNIIGSGPEEKNLKTIGKDLKHNNLFFYRDIKRKECIKKLKECDAFLQLSSYEGMSFSVLESLNLGKVMILSAIEPNIETAKTGAIYVNPNSIKEIRSAIELVKFINIRKVLVSNTYQINKTYYTKENKLAEYLNILKN